VHHESGHLIEEIRSVVVFRGAGALYRRVVISPVREKVARAFDRMMSRWPDDLLSEPNFPERTHQNKMIMASNVLFAVYRDFPSRPATFLKSRSLDVVA
jgi:hypothetical protein